MLHTEIAFSQVREDPEMDLIVLESIKTQNKKALMIGSGGCSVLTMLLSQDLERIDVIDANPAQIELIKLKIAALRNLTTKEYIDFVEGHNSLTHLEKLKHDEFYNQSFWEDSRLSQIEYGINQIGVFEQLFKELRNSFSVNPMLVLNEKEWSDAFNKVFDRDYLTEVFGEEAVKYSMSQEFSDHFSRVMKNAIEKYKGNSNYFLDQIFKGKYESDLPVYLEEDNKAVILENIGKMNFINQPFHDFIKQTSEQYDFIHTSNITDWLPLSMLDELYSDIKAHLRENGLVVSRRLNGDHSLNDVVLRTLNKKSVKEIETTSSYKVRFEIEKDFDFKESDKSFFYNELVVATI